MDFSIPAKIDRSRILGAIGVLSLLAGAACGAGGNGAQGGRPPGAARVAAPLAATVFPLKASANGRYLVDQTGTPFFMVGDSAQSAGSNLTLAEFQTYLDSRVAKGFNTVNINLIDHKFAKGGLGATLSGVPTDTNGDLPFTQNVAGGAFDGTWNTAYFGSPNDAYFHEVEQEVDYAASKGVLVTLNVFYWGFGGGDEGWSVELGLSANTQAVCLAFGQYIGNGRGVFGGFRGKTNLIWMIGDDQAPAPGSETETRLHRIMEGIQGTAPVSTLWTGSWGAPSISTDQAAFAAAMTLNAVYAYGMAAVDAQSRNAWQRAPAIPAYMKETAYELSQVGVSGTRLALRQAMYSSILAGATTGGLYGHRDIWSFNTSTWHATVDSTASGPWSSELDSPGAFDQARVGALFGSLAWWKLVPDGQGASGTLVTAGAGTFGGSDWIAAAAASDGTALVAYVPPNGILGRSFSVNMAAMSVASHAHWWDPTTGLYTEIATGIPNGGTRSFTTPGANSTGENDWILVLTPAAPSAPPTVATPASATPNPVTGTSTSLSVLGADDGGEASLVYTWSAVGTPPGPVTFSANGTNAAKSTTATFGAAGSYTLQATIRDADGQAVTSAVAVTVSQTTTRISVAPGSATVATGATQRFTASALDQFGRPLATQPSFAWTVSGGGAIDATGLFTAGPTAGGPFTVTASVGILSGGASVTVAAASAPRYQVNGGGAAAGTFSADQLFSAGSTFRTAGAIDVSGVASPAPAAVYQTERYGNFTYAFGGLTPGASYVVRLHFAEIWWTTAGSRLFDVAINGVQVLSSFDVFAAAGGTNRAIVEVFTAPADGGGQVVIQFTTLKDNAKVSGIEILGASSAPPTVAAPASATPNPVTGTSTSLSVLGADDGGEASLVYTWSVLGTPPGPVAFSANGTNAAKSATATFVAAGSYALQATIRDAQGQTATSAVTATVSQTATRISVAPASATVLTGATQQFTASAFDQFGRALATQPTFAWTVSGGGTIDPTGLFTAGTVAGGPFTVTASAGLVGGSASVTVVASAAPRYQVNGGGTAAGTFAADQLFSAGSTFRTASAIDVSGVTNPAPVAVYQTERYGSFNYAFGGLTPGAAYVVRLHFAEIWWTTAGSRLFDVSINGVNVLSSFDIFATAGGANRALVEAFTAPAEAGGQIVIQFTTVKDNAKVSGIEILGP
ncbi:MAG TPA: DUF4038 domain-containing protein [Anaeromyxobacter sp.]